MSRNYKYFFLLLFYTCIDCSYIVFTMAPSVRSGTEPSTPFMMMRPDCHQSRHIAHMRRT